MGIDGLNLAIPRGTGIATYARSLSACLTALGHPVDVLYGMEIEAAASPALRQVAFFDQLQTERGFRRPRYPSLRWARLMLAARRGLTAVPIPIDGLVEARPFADRLPRCERILNIESLFGLAGQYFRNFGRFVTVRIPDPPAIMHWTYPVPVILEGAHNIYTIHDMVPLRMPYATLDHKPTHAKLIAECLRRGDHICTVSERSREDVFSFFPDAEPDRVSNSYQAVLPPARIQSGAEVATLLRDGFGLQPGGYFLFFGSIEPKKNVARLLQAHFAADHGIPLVIVTARGWQAAAEAALLAGRDATDGRIRQIEYVPQDLLATLVRGARAVTFPSLYEGFGLPVLEAMLAGTPVLTSREGSLAEVAGDAALYVDPYDVDSIAQGLQRLATDDALCSSLRERGRLQAAQFSMAQYQARLRALYDTVLARPAR
ncbi:MAG: glycosyltransferase family 4 protein [Janthinobacterium lividum]